MDFKEMGFNFNGTEEGLDDVKKNPYEKYRESAKVNISDIKRYLKSDVLLTRRESFDFLFKVYAVGDPSDASLVNASYLDKKLAKFYAKNFLKIIDFDEYGYSYKAVRKFFRGVARSAWKDSISNGRYVMRFSDRDGVIYVQIVRKGKSLYELAIDSVESLMMMGTVAVSYLGSEYEDITKDKEFIADYLLGELKRYKSGVGAKIYVDRRKHDLKDKMYTVTKSDESKVVSFKVC